MVRVVRRLDIQVRGVTEVPVVGEPEVVLLVDGEDVLGEGCAVAALDLTPSGNAAHPTRHASDGLSQIPVSTAAPPVPVLTVRQLRTTCIGELTMDTPM